MKLKEQLKDPKRLFQLDGFGALLSMFMLGFVLVEMQWFFGIPKSTLYLLAAIPFFFGLYDAYCFIYVKKTFAPYLKAIAIANTLYCAFPIGAAIHHRQVITKFGWIYIILEIIIIMGLVSLQWQSANNQKADQS